MTGEDRRFDQSLVSDLLDGSATAIETVRSWIRRASGHHRRLLGDDVEDLEQEVLTSLVQGLREERFRHESTLETYVSRMVHYKCIDRIRQRGRRRWVDLDTLDLADGERSALTALESQQTEQWALRVASEVSADCRRLWDMVLEGLDYAAMARRTGVRTGTLRVRLLRCRRRAIEIRDRQNGLQDQEDQ